MVFLDVMVGLAAQTKESGWNRSKADLTRSMVHPKVEFVSTGCQGFATALSSLRGSWIFPQQP